MKMHTKKTPIIIALVFLTIASTLLIISYAVPTWLVVKANIDNYGVWYACKGNFTTCFKWYENGQDVFSFKMTDSFKAFQAIETIFLSTNLFAIVLLLISLKHYPTHTSLFIGAAFFNFLAAASGVTCLLIFVVIIYDSNVFNLGWCYWVSVASLAIDLFAFILICLYTVKIRNKASNNDKTGKGREMNGSRVDLMRNQVNNADLLETPRASSQKLQKIIKTCQKKNKKLQQQEAKKTHFSENRQDYVRDENETRNKIIPRLNENSNSNYSHSKEQFRPGYSAEPREIVNSLDRSWVFAVNTKQFPTSDSFRNTVFNS